MTRLQKRLAAKILKVGENRVWLNPTKMKDIEKAITRIDVKKLIKQKAIKALPPKIKKRSREKKRRKKTGSRKGAKYAKVTRKERWIQTVRPLRKMLKEMKREGQIDNLTYKKMRALVKGGMFRSRSHMRIYLEQHELLKK